MGNLGEDVVEVGTQRCWVLVPRERNVGIIVDSRQAGTPSNKSTCVQEERCEAAVPPNIHRIHIAKGLDRV